MEPFVVVQQTCLAPTVPAVAGPAREHPVLGGVDVEQGRPIGHLDLIDDIAKVEIGHTGHVVARALDQSERDHPREMELVVPVGTVHDVEVGVGAAPPVVSGCQFISQPAGIT